MSSQFAAVCRVWSSSNGITPMLDAYTNDGAGTALDAAQYDHIQ